MAFQQALDRALEDLGLAAGVAAVKRPAPGSLDMANYRQSTAARMCDETLRQPAKKAFRRDGRRRASIRKLAQFRRARAKACKVHRDGAENPGVICNIVAGKKEVVGNRLLK